MRILAVDDEKLMLERTASGINAYHGQYMAQYSWGEMMNASLNLEKNKKI